MVPHNAFLFTLLGTKLCGAQEFPTSGSTTFVPPYATRLSAGGVADEGVTQMLRQGDAQVFKKYSQMKLQMKREALEKINRRANEKVPTSPAPMCTVMMQ
jgi:hypothetical protein